MGVPEIKLDSSKCEIANVNPFRYRGYYYDGEIGLYYLQSRYYDANVGKFVNADNTSALSADNTVLNRKLKFRPMICEGQTAIGFIWDDKFKIMLHFKHKKEPEKGMHICIQRKTSKNWKKVIPDIPLKQLGNVFINWEIP